MLRSHLLEEIAAKYAKENITKPIIVFIAGEAATEGKRMGHAGAIVSPGGERGAKKKKETLRASGEILVEKLTELHNTFLRII